MERVLKEQEQVILASALKTFNEFKTAFEGSDKKRYKESLIQFFPDPEDVEGLLKEPYARYEDFKPEGWYEALEFIKEHDSFKVLKNSSESTVLEKGAIKADQFAGRGQIVEFRREIPDHAS